MLNRFVRVIIFEQVCQFGIIYDRPAIIHSTRTKVKSMVGDYSIYAIYGRIIIVDLLTAVNGSNNPQYSDLCQIQLIQLEMLLEVDRICKKNIIKYSIIAGTLLVLYVIRR
ncbi:hypothetical protein [Oceanobacillus kapialis]|uniref:Uncharacterized protein n=1 Tax=Oceanobacillus kapialis TaxID=481353 RepID=A0ABW5Q0X2_9BACI